MKRMTINQFPTVVIVLLIIIGSTGWCLAGRDREECGLCCSAWDFCRSIESHCGPPPPPPPPPPPRSPPPPSPPPPSPSPPPPSPPPPSPPPPSPPPPSPPPLSPPPPSPPPPSPSPPPPSPPPPSPPPPSPSPPPPSPPPPSPPPPSPSPPPPSPPPPPPVEEYLISVKDFNEMLKHHDDDLCEGKGFYTYEAFVKAAKTFPKFGNVGTTNSKKSDIAAFFSQSSHETSGGSTEGPYDWGYCFVKEPYPTRDYCEPSSEFPCAPGKQYYGRGPFQITGNIDYGRCGRAIGVDLLKNPDLVATDPIISFKSALWFWMTPPIQTSDVYMPACHEVMAGIWTPSHADQLQRRYGGYGMTTYVVTSSQKFKNWKCGGGFMTPSEMDRIGFYKRYCDILLVAYGNYVECYGYRSNSLTFSA